MKLKKFYKGLQQYPFITDVNVDQTLFTGCVRIPHMRAMFGRKGEIYVEYRTYAMCLVYEEDRYFPLVYQDPTDIKPMSEMVLRDMIIAAIALIDNEIPFLINNILNGLQEDLWECDDSDGSDIVANINAKVSKISSSVVYELAELQARLEGHMTTDFKFDPSMRTLSEEFLMSTSLNSDNASGWKYFKPYSGLNESSKLTPFPLHEERTLTPEETNLIPIMPQSYVPSKWSQRTCQKITLSGQFEKPFRNLLLYGPSGSGKSTGTRAMAYSLGLPYVKITCSPDSEIFDFVGQLIPNTDKYGEAATDDVLQNLNIPSFEDVEMDFAGTYQLLFGHAPDKYAEPADCYKEILQRGIASSKEGVNDFIYVESPLIQAVRNGYFCELQEPNIIKRAAVLVGLNALMESFADGATYTLPTGELIKRHPDCVIACTTNLDYEGCKKLQQSVFSRMDLVVEVPYPTADELASRVRATTNFPDEQMLHKMANVIGDINDFCKKNDITDGVCGPREFENWAKMAIILEQIRKGNVFANLDEHSVCLAAFPTVIMKVSQERADIEDVIAGAFQLTFSPKIVNDAREDYINGEW